MESISYRLLKRHWRATLHLHHRASREIITYANKQSELSVAPYMTAREAAEYLKCSGGYLSKGRVTGDGPRFLKLGKAIRYRLEDLDAWASDRMHASTAEYSTTSRRRQPRQRAR